MHGQCANVTVLILTTGAIYKKADLDEQLIRYVVLYSGEVGYFTTSHLPYAIPALFFLVTPHLVDFLSNV